MHFAKFLRTPFVQNSYLFWNAVIMSEKLWDYECSLITVFFIKTEEMSVKKKYVFITSNFCDFLQRLYCDFLKIELQ